MQLLADFKTAIILRIFLSLLSTFDLTEARTRNQCFPPDFQSVDISEFELLGRWYETSRTYFPLENWHSCVEFEFSLQSNLYGKLNHSTLHL